jgi:RNA polymerase sigma-70 factor, ECF subfamily
MTRADGSTDAELMRMAAAGDEEAFAEIYRRMQQSIYRFALHMSGSTAVAEDVTQEVFLALMKKPTAFDPARGSLAAFLIGIARKHLLRHFERTRPELRLAAESGEGPSATPEPLIEHADAFGDLSRAETIESVRRAILALPPRYREAVVLCDLEEMDYSEAAAAAGCAIGTVRSRLHRGRALLAKKLRLPGPLPVASGEVKTKAGANPKGCLA